jgi:cytochrome c553
MSMHHMSTCGLLGVLLALLWGAMPTHAGAADTSPDKELLRWQQQAPMPASATRGQALWSRQQGEWSCASCHGAPPVREGRHASTHKPLAPLAPAYNPQRLSEQAKVDKWLRRNCKDVFSRECSAQEKADVIAYLISLK